MKLYSTKDSTTFVSLKEAVFKGLPSDNGLYMPDTIPQLEADFINNLKNHSFQSIAFTVAQTLLRGVIPDKDLKRLIEQSIDFPAPVVKLDDTTHVSGFQRLWSTIHGTVDVLFQQEKQA
jgi:threonine synthase